MNIDKYLLRGLVEAHAKVPLEHIYLELAVLPILYVLSVGLKRHGNEISRKIHRCQKISPQPGDWCHLIADDFDKIDIHMTEDLEHR